MMTNHAEGDTEAHARRLAWTLSETGKLLPPALLRDRSTEAERLRELPQAEQSNALARLIMEQADPSSNKRFTPWLAQQYAKGRLILEDLGSAGETLTLFQRYVSRLPAAQRDIQRYESLAAAWEAVRAFSERDDLHPKKRQRALDRARAYAESRILRQGPDGFTVAVPLTEFAAKWWGKGTRWCTAAERSNAFWGYQEKAPVIVLVIPGHGKFQLWVTKHEFQFMDAADCPVPRRQSWLGKSEHLG